MNINIQVLVIMGVYMIIRSWNEAAKNDELKLNDEEWSSWEMKDERIWCMEWRFSYPSSYIDARSLQDHMEVGMGQFGVKVNKKSTSGWANSSIGLYTRVWSVFNTSGISGQGILEYGSVYSSIQLLSALQLHTVSRSARATSDVSTISHKPEIRLRRN